MTTIDRFITPSPHTVSCETSVAAAHRLMKDHRIRHLPVVSEGCLVGVISARDLDWLERTLRVDAASMPVAEAMTTEPFVVQRGSLVQDAARQMAKRKISSAIVLEGSEVVGIFTLIDALRALIEIATPSSKVAGCGAEVRERTRATGAPIAAARLDHRFGTGRPSAR